MAKKTSLSFTIALFATNLVVMQRKYLSSLQRKNIFYRSNGMARNNTDVSFSCSATGCEVATRIFFSTNKTKETNFSFFEIQ